MGDTLERGFGFSKLIDESPVREEVRSGVGIVVPEDSGDGLTGQERRKIGGDPLFLKFGTPIPFPTGKIEVKIL